MSKILKKLVLATKRRDREIIRGDYVKLRKAVDNYYKVLSQAQGIVKFGGLY